MESVFEAEAVALWHALMFIQQENRNVKQIFISNAALNLAIDQA